MNRVQAYLDAVETALKGATPAFADVRVQLDAIDEEDITRQGFQTPAARVILMRGLPVRNPDRSIDVDLAIGVAVMAQAEGRQRPEEVALDAMMGALALIDNNRFGLKDIGFPRDLQFRGALPAAETKGISVLVLAYQQRLLRVTEGVAMARGPIGGDEVQLPAGLDGSEP